MLHIGMLGTALITLAMATGCGSTVQPSVGSGEVNDKTLNGNTVDFSFFKVQNHYGNTTSISDSDYGKVER